MIMFLLPYLFIMWLSFGSTNIISSLIVLEILSWVFIQLLFSFDVIKYLIIQSIFFLLSVVGLMWIKTFLLMGIFLKMGLPPFHMWMIRLLMSLKKSPFIIILTLHKLLPLLLLSKGMKETNKVFSVSLLMVVLMVLIGNLSTLFLVLGLSSMLHSFWMVLSSLTAVSLLSTYWFTYSFLSLIFIQSLYSSWMRLNEFNQTLMTSFSWLLMSGIPPFTLFWLKAHVSLGVLVEMSLPMGGLFLLSSVLALSAYYRVWHFSESMACLSGSTLFMLTGYYLCMSSV